MAGRIDLNADLGEGMADDAALMPLVTSCNIACGGHAGDEATMRTALELARSNGVRAGAHPAYPDKANFGRSPMDLPDPVLRDTLVEQIAGLAEIAGSVGITLTHVKPHGALYHRAEGDPGIAGLLAQTVASLDPSLRLVGPPDSALDEAANAAGLAFVAEGFADRAYGSSGRLIPRSTPGAVLADAEASAAQAVSIATQGHVETIDRTRIALDVQTLCLHGDTPGALERARAVRAALESAGLEIAPPA